MAPCGRAQLGSLFVSVMGPVVALKSLLTYCSDEEAVGLSVEW